MCHYTNVRSVDRAAHAKAVVMVWAGVRLGPQTQMPFIGGILNADRYSEEILRAMVVPFIINTLQHYARLHVDSRICSQFLAAENAQPSPSPCTGGWKSAI